MEHHSNSDLDVNSGNNNLHKKRSTQLSIFPCQSTKLQSKYLYLKNIYLFWYPLGGIMNTFHTNAKDSWIIFYIFIIFSNVIIMTWYLYLKLKCPHRLIDSRLWLKSIYIEYSVQHSINFVKNHLQGSFYEANIFCLN